jgi:hypothetical protein
VKKYAAYLVVHHDSGDKVGQTIVFKACGMHDALAHAETTALTLGGAEIVAMWQASRGDFRVKA